MLDCEEELLLASNSIIVSLGGDAQELPRLRSVVCSVSVSSLDPAGCLLAAVESSSGLIEWWWYAVKIIQCLSSKVRMQRDSEAIVGGRARGWGSGN